MSPAQIPENEANSPISVRALSSSDLKIVFEFFQRVSSTVRHGFMAERSFDDFREIMREDAKFAGAGAFNGASLVGYAICCAEDKLATRNSPLVRTAQENGETFWTGKGSLIDPQYRGRKILEQLAEKRVEIFEERGGRHLIGLIATENRASLTGFMRLGMWVVGLERDEYCLNYIVYLGNIQSTIGFESEYLVPLEDLELQTKRLADGWIGTELIKDEQTGRQSLKFRRSKGANQSARTGA